MSEYQKGYEQGVKDLADMTITEIKNDLLKGDKENV